MPFNDTNLPKPVTIVSDLYISGFTEKGFCQFYVGTVNILKALFEALPCDVVLKGFNPLTILAQGEYIS